MSKKNQDSKSWGNLTKKDERLMNKKRKWEAFLAVCKANDDDGRTRKTKKKFAGNEEELMSNSSPRNSTGLKVTELVASATSSDDSEEVNGPSTSKRPRKNGQTNGNHSTSVNNNKLTHARIEEELKSMRAEISRRRGVRNPPVLRVGEVGRRAQFQMDATFEVVPLFASDLKHLLLVAMFGQLSPRRPRWCTIDGCSGISHTAVVLVEGISVSDCRRHADSMKWTKGSLELTFEVLPSQQFKTKAIDEILSVVDVMQTNSNLLQSEYFANQDDDFKTDDYNASKKFEGFFKISGKKSRNMTVNDKFHRTRLLLSPEQMLIENFPFHVPGMRVEEGYVFTKDKYDQVTPDSPLFGVDCEMCMTLSGENELARISIVNEQLNVIYDELVKPRNKITNYLTRFSGISAKMMENVNTRIENVQAEVGRILPPDAILCGQSLNMDLRAMKMMHPYVIDTSVIYNLSGIRRMKASLKNLAKLFLKQDIQNKHGHNSIEDSRAALRLVQLKLANSIEFGNVISIPEGESMTNGHTGQHVSSTLQKKKVAVLSSAELSELKVPTDRVDLTVSTMQCGSNKNVVQRMQEVAMENDLAIAHMTMSVNETNAQSKEQKKFSKLDKRLRKIYEACAVNSLFVVIFADSVRKSNIGFYENGIFMLRIRPPFT